MEIELNKVKTRGNITEGSFQVKMGILRDNVFSATPPLEAVRLLMSLMMTEQSSLPCVIQKTSVLRSCLRNERGQDGVWSVAQEHVRNTRRDGEFRSGCHGRTDEHGVRGWNISSVHVQNTTAKSSDCSTTAATS